MKDLTLLKNKRKCAYDVKDKESLLIYMIQKQIIKKQCYKWTKSKLSTCIEQKVNNGWGKILSPNIAEKEL